MTNTKSEQDLLIIKPHGGLMRLMQWPWETINNAFTSYKLTNEKLVRQTGILRLRLKIKSLYFLDEDPSIKRRTRYRLIDLVRRIFKKPPLYLADIYIHRSGASTYWICLKSTPYAPKVADTISDCIKIAKERRGVKVFDKGQNPDN